MNSIRLSAVIISSAVQRTCSNLLEPVLVTVVCNIHNIRVYNNFDLGSNRLSSCRLIVGAKNSGIFITFVSSRTSSIVISRARG